MKLKTLTVDIDPKALTFDTLRALTDEFLKSNPKEGKRYWDCMAALRGPDVGYPDADGLIHPALADGNAPGAEHARVTRKQVTTAIIRAHMFPGAAGCSAAQMNTDPSAIIVLPSKEKWDHFDKHVFKAAVVLGIPTQIGDEPPVGQSGNYIQIPGTSYLLQLTGSGVPEDIASKTFAKGRVFFLKEYNAPYVLMQDAIEGDNWEFTPVKGMSQGPDGSHKTFMVAGTQGNYQIVLFAPCQKASKQASKQNEYMPILKHLPQNHWGMEKGIDHPVGSDKQWAVIVQALKGNGGVHYWKDQEILMQEGGKSGSSKDIWHLYRRVKGPAVMADGVPADPGLSKENQ